MGGCFSSERFHLPEPGSAEYMQARDRARERVAVDSAASFRAMDLFTNCAVSIGSRDEPAQRGFNLYRYPRETHPHIQSVFGPVLNILVSHIGSEERES